MSEEKRSDRASNRRRNDRNRSKNRSSNNRPESGNRSNSSRSSTSRSSDGEGNKPNSRSSQNRRRRSSRRPRNQNDSSTSDQQKQDPRQSRSSEENKQRRRRRRRPQHERSDERDSRNSQHSHRRSAGSEQRRNESYPTKTITKTVDFSRIKGDPAEYTWGDEHLYHNAEILEGELTEVVCAKISTAPLVNYDAQELAVTRGDHVVCEVERGLGVAKIVGDRGRELLPQKLPRIIRKVSLDDPRVYSATQREKEAYDYCRACIRERDLPMKLIRVEYLQSGNKALFYFSAENRIDFRELVKDLAKRLHARIEMRQVGVRDESRISSGIGPCGQSICCGSWITEFQPVSIRMAKDQNLVLNPTKVSGMCGRLKCCLAYEQAVYKEARKNLPKVGHKITTPNGPGRVHEIDVPRELLRVLLDDGNIETFEAAKCSFNNRGLGDSKESKQDSEEQTKERN